MSSEIVRQFDSAEFGALRVVKDDQNEPWFVASDIAKTLGYRDANKLTRRLEDDEKGTRQVGTPSGTQTMSVINEAGLYNAILGSKVPQAKRFKRWVTHEVLPAIRQSGGYMVARDETPEETMARAYLIAQDTINRQQQRIGELEPKALFADAVSTSKSTILVADLAKILNQNGYKTGATRLFATLREQGYLCKQKGAMWNTPTQRSRDMDLIRIKETAVTHSDGHVTISKTPKITGKGQIYFINHFCQGTQDA